MKGRTARFSARFVLVSAALIWAAAMALWSRQRVGHGGGLLPTFFWTDPFGALRLLSSVLAIDGTIPLGCIHHIQQAARVSSAGPRVH